MKNLQIILETVLTLAVGAIGVMLFAGVALTTQPNGAVESDPYFLPILVLLIAAPLRFLLCPESGWLGLKALSVWANRAAESLAHRLGQIPPLLLALVWLLILGVYLFAVHPPRDAGLQVTLSPGGESEPFPDVKMTLPSVNIDSPDLRRHAWWARDLRSKWKGYLYVPKTGRYPFEVHSDGHAWIRIDDATAMVNMSFWKFDTVAKEIDLEEGSHAIEVEYWDAWLSSAIFLRWDIGDGMRPIPPENFSQAPMTSGDYARRTALVKLAHISFGLLILYGIVLITLALRGVQQQKYFERPAFRRGVLAAIVLIGAGLRVWIWWTTRGMMIADEAVVGVAAMRILQGEWPLIYYGQPYGGLFESYLAAPLFLIFGCSNLVLKAVPLALGVLLIPLVYVLGRRIFNPMAGLIAAAYVTLPPVMCTIYSLMMMVGPIEIPVFGVIALLWTERLGRTERLGWAKDSLLFLALGILLGFAFWVNGQIIYFILAISVYLLLRRGWRVLLGPAWAGVLGTVIGLTPLIIHNVRNQSETFGFLFSKDAAGGFLFTGMWDSLRSILLNRCFPAILGGSVQWKLTENLPFGPLPVMVYVLAIIGGIWVLSICLSRWRFGIGERTHPADLLLIFCLILPVIFSGSKFGYYSGGATGMPRYVFAAFPIIAILFGGAIHALGRRSVLLAVVVTMPVLLLNFFGNFLTDRFYFFQPVHFLSYQDKMLPYENGTLLKYLEEKNLTAVFTDYWIGTQFPVESCENIKTDTERDRFEPYADAVRHSWNPVYLYHTNDQKSRTLDNMFDFMAWPHDFIAPFKFYWAPGNVPPKAQWKITSYLADDDASRAVDGDMHLEAAYFSPTPQHKGMYLRVDMGEVIQASGIMLYREDVPPDQLKIAGPGKANVFLSMDGEHYDDLRGALEHNEASRSDLIILGPTRFRAFHIVLDQVDPVNHWSVNEIFVW